MGLKFPKNAISFFIPGDNDDICYNKKEIDMKNYNLKPLYIFLIIFAGAWAIKLLTMDTKEIEGTKIHFQQNGEYKNSFEKNMHESGSEVKNDLKEIQGEAMEKDSIAIIPTYNG
jgi:hypothetical protein